MDAAVGGGVHRFLSRQESSLYPFDHWSDQAGTRSSKLDLSSLRFAVHARCRSLYNGDGFLEPATYAVHATNVMRDHPHNFCSFKVGRFRRKAPAPSFLRNLAGVMRDFSASGKVWVFAGNVARKNNLSRGPVARLSSAKIIRIRIIFTHAGFPGSWSPETARSGPRLNDGWMRPGCPRIKARTVYGKELWDSHLKVRPQTTFP